MNSFIEFLNLWGDRFIQFALPMLIQSSLLMAILLVLDLILRKRVRAVLRYGLWMLVLIKLILPPSFASPTGVGYWLTLKQPAKPVVAPAPVRITVSYSEAEPIYIPSTTPLPPPKPAMTWPAIFLLGWASVAFGLVTWLVLRARFVARMSARANDAPDSLLELLGSCRRQLSIKRPIRLKLSSDASSPAVCGLWRPTILIPAQLADKLSALPMRAVLLHELAHIKRGDLWVNYAQTLLQIAYWYNPLLWLANAIIRRVREQAVDEMVMVEMGQQAHAYPTTLLEVAKLSFTRSVLSLGLVGIMESKSALKERIQTLLTRPIPKIARLGWKGSTCVALLGLITLPMASHPKANAVEVNNKTSETPPVIEANAANPYPRTNRSTISSGRLAILSKLDRIRLDSVRYDGVSLAEVVKILGIEAKNRDPEKKGINFIINPYVEASAGSLINPYTGLPEESERIDMNSIAITINPAMTDVRLTDVLDAIVKVAGKPIKYSIEDYAVVFSSKVQEAAPLYTRFFKVDPNAFYQALENAGALSFGNSITNSGNGDGALIPRVVVPAGTNGPESQSVGGLHFVTRQDQVDIVHGVRAFFLANGVDLSPPKTIFFKDRQGMLMVRAIAEELEVVERLIASINATPVAVTNASAAGQTNRLPTVNPQKAEAATLVQDGRVLFESGKLDEAEAKLKEAQKIDPGNRGADYYLNLIKEIRSAKLARKRGFGSDSQLYPNLQNHLFKVDTNTFIANLRNEAKLTESSGPEEEERALFRLLSMVRADLEPPKTLWLDARQGIVLVHGATPHDITVIEKALTKLNGSPLLKAGPFPEPSLMRPPRNPATQEGVKLYTRFFRLDTYTFLTNLRKQTELADISSREEQQRAVRKFFSNAGVDFQPPKNIFFNDTNGLLMVRATLHDLDVVEEAVQNLNIAPPQITIEARFIEVTEQVAKELWRPVHLTNNVGTNAWTSILTESQMKTLLKQLADKPGDLLNATRVTTLSGRQTHIQVEDTQTVRKGINPQALAPPGVTSTFTDGTSNSLYVTETMSFGPAIDVIPYVMADGYTISMTVIPTVTEFLGYDENNTNRVPVYINGKREWGKTPLPTFRTRQFASSAHMWDGQTLMLGNPFDSNNQLAEKPGDGKKRLIVLVTPTIIDPAGNRLHAEEEMPFARDGVPPQPGIK